ncbi:MAG: type II/IV secretion system protein [Tissierellia bacterium]|nr:type II/IV secretion system protein [Tissierellia bacterium]
MFNKFNAEELIYKIENIDLSNLNSQLDISFFVKNRVIPVEIGTDSIFVLSIVNDYNTISNIEHLTKRKCNLQIIDTNTFDFLFDKMVKRSRVVTNNLNLISIQLGDDNKNIETINYLNKMIENAIIRGVSDIHIEPFKSSIRVRFRIDGKLVTQGTLRSDLYSIIITRMKILAKLDITERRLPQDGRITFEFSKRDIDLRISTIPTIYGEKIALRILDSEFKFKNLDSLGLGKENLEIIVNEITKLSGLIVVCGPTNSGKTTTIYSILNNINDESINIVTLEDPVEYKIDGINQIQINYKTGLEFINTLNHILRQDPDVISIGEIRDDETVQTALRAAITGHFVFSTLHTSNSISAIYRLKDMKGESYLISNALKLIISQRLVRKLCPHCKKEYHVESSLIPHRQKIFRAVGCVRCNQGYSGRLGVFELLKIDNKIKYLIEKNASYDEILLEAKKNGFKTLEENLIQSVIDGTTTLEEIMKII